jgi:hypothetical protein
VEREGTGGSAALPTGPTALGPVPTVEDPVAVWVWDGAGAGLVDVALIIIIVSVVFPLDQPDQNTATRRNGAAEYGQTIN